MIGDTELTRELRAHVGELLQMLEHCQQRIDALVVERDQMAARVREYELTEQAEKFIEENKDRPFFLYLAHNSPHVPLAAKPELIEKHKGAFNPTYAAMMSTLDECVA